MNKISVAVKSDNDITLNGFRFTAKSDGYAYCEIFPKQWHYISRIIKNIEKKEFTEPKKRIRKPKVDVLPDEVE